MRKGQKHSEETRKKMRKSASKRKTPPLTEEHKEKLRISNKKTWSDVNKRREHSIKTKQALSQMSENAKTKQIEKSRKSWTKERRKKASELMKKQRRDAEWLEKSHQAKRGKPGTWLGRKHTVESRLKISKAKKESPNTPRGPNNPAYIDGKGNERRGKRLAHAQTIEYRLFREAVLKRDCYKCVKCKCAVNLHVDHIKSYRHFPELRTCVSNGRTLCAPCHRKTKNYGRKS